MAVSATLPCIINLLVTKKHLTSDGLIFLLDWDVVGIAGRHSRVSPILWRSDSGRIREQWLHPSNYRWLWRNGHCAQGPEDKLLTAPFPFPAFALQLAETFNSHGRLCVCYHVFKKESFGIYVFGQALASYGSRITLFLLFCFFYQSD